MFQLLIGKSSICIRINVSKRVFSVWRFFSVIIIIIISIVIIMIILYFAIIFFIRYLESFRVYICIIGKRRRKVSKQKKKVEKIKQIVIHLFAVCNFFFFKQNPCRFSGVATGVNNVLLICFWFHSKW